AVQEKSGFIPNVFLVLAHRPEEFRAFFAYHDALMDKPSNLTKAEREMIVVATSNLNQCQYCVVRPCSAGSKPRATSRQRPGPRFCLSWRGRSSRFRDALERNSENKEMPAA